LLLSAISAFSLDRAHFLELNKKGRELRQKQDWKGLRDVLLEIGKELPSPSPMYFLRMASVETRLGNHTAALDWMQRYVNMGLSYDISADDDLKPLLSDPGWKALAEKMKAVSQPFVHGQKICTLPITDLMPEDLASDATGRMLYVTSVRHYSLYRVTLPGANEAQCRLDEVPLPANAKRWPTLAVSFDNTRNLVWLTSSAMPEFASNPPGDDGKTALLAIDPRNGSLLYRFDLAGNQPGVLGDMTVTAQGSIFVSDSIGGGVYRVQGDIKAAHLEKIAEGFFSPQTPAIAADGQRLFVADYAIGIAVIDLHDHNKVSYLPMPDNVAATGLDGLLRVGNTLIGVQNGTRPARIVRYQLNRQQTRVESAEVLAQGEELGEPTHAIAVNGRILVTANVGWNRIDDHGNLKPNEKFTEPYLLSFPQEENRKTKK
ncbi:MAG TPA: hypothetical protein VFR08_01050, partial [Candidatus Angelobacter sp.]|nr:hypothetical protein [Candidatus Angelobacter sp.]